MKKIYSMYMNVVVQLLSCTQFFATPWTVANQAPLSSIIFQSLLKFMSIESMMLPNHLILYCPLLLWLLIFPSIKVFSNELALCIRCPKYWSFSICHSSEYSGLISFRIDWIDLLAVQGTLKSLLQHHNLQASVLLHSAFFMVKLSHHTWLLEKPSLCTFVSKLMSPLFNMLSRFVKAFLPRSKQSI